MLCVLSDPETFRLCLLASIDIIERLDFFMKDFLYWLRDEDYLVSY
jgi:hypothetical protein